MLSAPVSLTIKCEKCGKTTAHRIISEYDGYVEYICMSCGNRARLKKETLKSEYELRKRDYIVETLINLAAALNKVGNAYDNVRFKIHNVELEYELSLLMNRIDDLIDKVKRILSSM